VIAHNPLAFRVTASSVAAGHGAIAAFAPQDVPSFSRRSSIGLAVLGLHIAVAYAFLSGFINPPIAPDPEPLRAAVIYQPSEPTLTPPGPHLGLTTFEPFAPPRDVSLKLPTMVDETNSNLVQPPQEATSMTQQMIRVLGGPGVGFPRTNDFYPAASIRLGEAGASAVRVCVDSDGRLIGDPKIAESSGSARLDAGALALSRAGSGHYRSTTEDGKPVASCYAYRVRFQMR
jgi:TonB family protein